MWLLLGIALASADVGGGPVGAGVALGAPSGVTGRVRLGDANGLQVSIGGDLGVEGNVATTADYTFHFDVFTPPSGEYTIPLHVGVGGRMSSTMRSSTTEVLVGPRAVVGATVRVTEAPVELFLDLAPTLLVYDEVTWAMDGQIGIRFYP